MAFSGLGSVWSKLIGGVASFAIGGATAGAIEPIIEPIRQDAWRNQPTKVLDAATAAVVQIRGGSPNVDAVSDAEASGYTPERFAAMVLASQSPPDTGSILELLRRGLIDEPTARAGLLAAGSAPDWVDLLLQLQYLPLSPQDAAMARQQAFIDQATQQAIAAKGGVSADDAELQYKISGMPPGIMEGIELLRRGLITEARFAEYVQQGHTKPEYIPDLLQLQKAVLSLPTAVMANLRQQISRDQALEIAAQNGYSADDFQISYEAAGRPPGPMEAISLFRRGAPSPTGSGQFTYDDFATVIARSDLRPEYAQSLWALRENIPGLFELRNLINAGTIPDQLATDLLTKEGYSPELVSAIVKGGHSPKSATAKQESAAVVTTLYESGAINETEQTSRMAAIGYNADVAADYRRLAELRREVAYFGKVLTVAHSEYVHRKVGKDETLNVLSSLGVTPDAKQALLSLWTAEQAASVLRLTAAQVEKALHDGLLSPQDAHDRLVTMGYPDEDAQMLVAIQVGPGYPGSVPKASVPPPLQAAP